MSLASYSGMTAKVKAMQGRLFTPADFERLSAEPSVASAIAFVLAHPGYEALAGGEAMTRRENMERALRESLFNDFRRLYRFGNAEQKAFLKLYFTRYEAWLIKYALRYILAGRSPYPLLADYLPLFGHIASFDTEAFLRSADAAEAAAALHGTLFEEPLRIVSANAMASLFDFETAVDLAHFSHVWKARDKKLSPQDTESLTAAYGTRIDLLNLQWIFRAMHFYHQSGSAVTAMLIPVRYRLGRGEAERLAAGPVPESFDDLLTGTAYEKMVPLFAGGAVVHTEAVCADFLADVYQKAADTHPHTAAIMNAYLYRKEAEVKAITTVIEGIRYGLTPAESLAGAFPIRTERRYLS